MSAPITGDALLLALAAQYRTMGGASEAFGNEASRSSGTISNYCSKQSNEFYIRYEAIFDAIAAIKADGAPGAMVQLEVLHKSLEDGDYTEGILKERQESLRNSIIFSVYGVLAGMTQHTAAEGLRVLPPYRDSHRADVVALISEWRARSDAEGISCAEETLAGRRDAA